VPNFTPVNVAVARHPRARSECDAAGMNADKICSGLRLLHRSRVAADPSRVELDVDGIVVRPPCCPLTVTLPLAEVSPLQPRRVTCRACARAWRLDLWPGVEAGWTASWTLVWVEPTLRRWWGWRR